MDGRLVLPLAIVFAGLTGGTPSAQVPTIESLRTGTATISGQVVDARSGEPLGNVVVSLTAPKVMGLTQTRTDEAGAYQFAGLAEHEYHVLMMDPLYVRSCYGATDVMQLACGAVALLRNQQRTGIDFRVNPTSILRGRVLDDTGRPVGGANLAAQPAPSAPPAGLPSSGRSNPTAALR